MTTLWRTFDVECDVVRADVIGRFGTDLTVVEPVVHRTNVLDDQAPLTRPLIVVNADTRVADKRKQANSQRVDFVMATPRDLQHITWRCYVCPVTWPACKSALSTLLLPRDATQAPPVYAVMRCLSVRLSVTFVDFVETNKRIFNIFHRRVATPFWFLRNTPSEYWHDDDDCRVMLGVCQ